MLLTYSHQPELQFVPVSCKPRSKVVSLLRLWLLQEETPVMAYFSSRGPIVAGDGNLLKPDITAPGVNVVAQVDPSSYWGHGYNAAPLDGKQLACYTTMCAPYSNTNGKACWQRARALRG